MPAKVFVINENGDYFWLDRKHLCHHPPVRAAARRSGRRGRGAHAGARVFVSVHSAVSVLYAAAVHARERCEVESMKAIQVDEPGGPEKMQLVEAPTPRPGPRQALVRIAASGVNFIDIYFRTGLYKADFPITLGSEAAGTVEAWARRSPKWPPATAWPMPWRAAPTPSMPWCPPRNSSRCPDDLDFHTAAAAMLQGMTAHYLTHSTYALKSGDTCLVHAAAGGAGGLIAQMAKMLGARVFGTVSTEEKAAIARQHGVDEAILYTQQDFDAEVKRLTGGRGVDVVYDSVGKTTFEQEPQLAAPARPAGPVRAIERPRSALRPHHPQRQGLAVPDPAQPGTLRADARGTALARRRRARLDRRRQAAAAHRRAPIRWPRPPQAHRDLEAARPPASCC